MRNLLLIIDDSRGVDDWLAQVRGITPEDVAMLRSDGLIAECGGVPKVPKVPSAAGPDTSVPPDNRESEFQRSRPAEPVSVSGNDSHNGNDHDNDNDWTRAKQTIRSASYNALYDALTGVARSRLGLMRGYRFALDVEKCNGRDELRELGLTFARRLRAEHGMAAVGELAYAIGSGTP